MYKLKKITRIITVIFGLLPLVVLAQTKLDNPILTIDPNELYARLVGGLMMVTGTLTLAVTILGGYRILTAAGNSENFQKGKKMIAYSFIGLFLTMASYGILATTINVLNGGTGGSCTGKTGVEFVNCQSLLFDPLNITKGPGEFYGQRILGFALSGLGALTLLIIIYGGFLWLTSAGNEERISKAKKTLGYGVLGLIIILGSYSLVNFIYQPVYKIVTGQTVEPGQATANNPPADKLVPCFRFSTTTTKDKLGNDKVVNKNYGGACSMETERACQGAVDGKSRGQAYYKIGQTTLKDCGEIGACVQNYGGAGGGDFKNRIAAAECDPTIFRPIGAVTKEGRCSFPTITGDQPLAGNNCYAPATFMPGQDYPSDNASSDEDWACVRKNSFAPEADSSCKLETSATCATECKPSDLFCGTEKPTGKWYRGFNCSQIGYCSFNHAGKKDCKDGVAQGMCAPKLFPSVGYPNRLWGCSGFLATGYELIDGQCFVSQSELHWTPNKFCPWDSY